MGGVYVVPIDPNELNRFVSFDPRYDDEEDDCDDDDALAQSEALAEEMRSLLESQEYKQRLQVMLERIPPREADIIDLYFLMDKRQADIATIFGMTQAAVSYRLARGIKRIRFLLDIPDVSREQMLSDLSEVFVVRVGKDVQEADSRTIDGIHIDVQILVHMWETTCQSVVAQQLQLTQGRVRHRFFKAVARLKEAAAQNSKYEPYEAIFSKIANKNFNVLRAVVLPQWQGRGGDEIT